MQALKVPADRGIGWIGDGWRIFAASPGMWIVLTIVWVLITFAVQTVPLVGTLAGLFLAPILGGGLLLAADDVHHGREPDIGNLFRPLTDTHIRNPAVGLAGLYLGANVALFLACLLVFGAGLGLAMLQGSIPDLPTDPGAIDPSRIEPAMLFALGGIAIVAGLLVVALALIVTILFFFAIPLVTFGRARPGEAVGTGTRALLHNWAPLTILGLLYLPMSLLATLPLGLGWLILLPMTIGMWYASYRDIFPDSVPTEEPELAGSHPASPPA